jgi:hypothetical protein
MRRILLSAFCIGLILCTGINYHPALAAGGPPPCQPTQPENGPRGHCNPTMYPANNVKMKSTVPFVFVRSSPSSNGLITATVYPSASANFQLTADHAWDGYQWWWKVAVIPKSQRIVGWVEQMSLTLYADDAFGLAVWRAPSRGTLDRGIYEAQVKSYPTLYPDIGYVVTLLHPEDTFTLSATEEPYWDPYSHRWWWWIEVKTTSGVVSGWVEQREINIIP